MSYRGPDQHELCSFFPLYLFIFLPLLLSLIYSSGSSCCLFINFFKKAHAHPTALKWSTCANHSRSHTFIHAYSYVFTNIPLWTHVSSSRFLFVSSSNYSNWLFWALKNLDMLHNAGFESMPPFDQSKGLGLEKTSRQITLEDVCILAHSQTDFPLRESNQKKKDVSLFRPHTVFLIFRSPSPPTSGPSAFACHTCDWKQNAYCPSFLSEVVFLSCQQIWQIDFPFSIPGCLFVVYNHFRSGSAKNFFLLTDENGRVSSWGNFVIWGYDSCNISCVFWTKDRKQFLYNWSCQTLCNPQSYNMYLNKI